MIYPQKFLKNSKNFWLDNLKPRLKSTKNILKKILDMIIFGFYSKNIKMF